MYATPMPSFNRSDRKSTRLNSSHSLHDALPISLTAFASSRHGGGMSILTAVGRYIDAWNVRDANAIVQSFRSEEHTSELQSLPTRRSSDLFDGVRVFTSRRGYEHIDCGWTLH